MRAFPPFLFFVFPFNGILPEWVQLRRPAGLVGWLARREVHGAEIPLAKKLDGAEKSRDDFRHVIPLRGENSGGGVPNLFARGEIAITC